MMATDEWNDSLDVQSPFASVGSEHVGAHLSDDTGEDETIAVAGEVDLGQESIVGLENGNVSPVSASPFGNAVAEKRPSVETIPLPVGEPFSELEIPVSIPLPIEVASFDNDSAVSHLPAFEEQGKVSGIPFGSVDTPLQDHQPGTYLDSEVVSPFGDSAPRIVSTSGSVDSLATPMEIALASEEALLRGEVLPHFQQESIGEESSSLLQEGAEIPEESPFGIPRTTREISPTVPSSFGVHPTAMIPILKPFEEISDLLNSDLASDVAPRSPFESVFETIPIPLVSPVSGKSNMGRPAGSVNKPLSDRAKIKVAKVKKTRIVSSDLPQEVLDKAVKTARKNAVKDDHMIDGIRLTPRDYMMLTFLARYRVATVGQLARAFDTSQTALRNRLPRLERAGLITWAWGASTKPKLWLITDAGLDTVGMDLNSPTVKWGQLRHTLGLVDLGIDFEKAKEVVLTEREIRAAATRHLPTSRMKSAIGPETIDASVSYEERATMVQGFIRQSLILPISTRAFGHIPDMVLVRQPYPNGASGNISIELELTRKSISEWKTILTAYRDSHIFSEVYYFVLSGELKRSLNSVVKKISAEQKIKVLDFKPVDLTADPYISGSGYVEIEE